MTTLLRKLGLRGFTLIELLVVIAIIAILAAILVPAVSDALLRGRLTQVMSNGKNIYTALFAKEMEDAVFMRIAPYARYGGSLNISNMEFTTTTEYFQWVVTSGVMNVEFAFFAAPGVPPTSGTNAANFTAQNNAWAAGAGIGEATPDGTPMLFTRNLQITALSQVRTDQPIDLPTVLPTAVGNRENSPFGDKAMVIVFKGGSTLAPRAKDVQGTFNRLGATNQVLRPGTGY
jgi:prepilin-type N-terminal cleavage/methylation domain-containing protein